MTYDSANLKCFKMATPVHGADILGLDDAVLPRRRTRNVGDEGRRGDFPPGAAPLELTQARAVGGRPLLSRSGPRGGAAPPVGSGQPAAQGTFEPDEPQEKMGTHTPGADGNESGGPGIRGASPVSDPGFSAVSLSSIPSLCSSVVVGPAKDLEGSQGDIDRLVIDLTRWRCD